MDEMERRGYHPNKVWYNPSWRGSTLGNEEGWCDADLVDDQYAYATHKGGIIYPEHNETYLHECIALLRSKGAECDWEKTNKIL